jgi:DNA-binding winged helix-turn-helix (wHTH) protein
MVTNVDGNRCMLYRTWRLGEYAPMVRFGEFTLDPRRRRLSRSGAPIDITPKCLDLLIALVSQAGVTLSRATLASSVWGGEGMPSEATLTQHVFMLRRVLGDGEPAREFVATIPRVGYQFVGEIEPIVLRTW